MKFFDFESNVAGRNTILDNNRKDGMISSI